MPHDTHPAAPLPLHAPACAEPLSPRRKLSRASFTQPFSAAVKKSAGARKLVAALTPRHAQSPPLSPRSGVRGKTISLPIPATAVDTARGRLLHNDPSPTHYTSLVDGAVAGQPILPSCASPGHDAVSLHIYGRASPEASSAPAGTRPSGEHMPPAQLSPQNNKFEPHATSPTIASTHAPTAAAGRFFEDADEEDPFRFAMFLSDAPARSGGTGLRWGKHPEPAEDFINDVPPASLPTDAHAACGTLFTPEPHPNSSSPQLSSVIEEDEPCPPVKR